MEQEGEEKEKSCLYLGIRLDEQKEKNREILNNYLSSGIGDIQILPGIYGTIYSYGHNPKLTRRLQDAT